MKCTKIAFTPVSPVHNFKHIITITSTAMTAKADTEIIEHIQ